MKIKILKARGVQYVQEGDRFIPPPCICPQPGCKHCNPDEPPYCPFLIDVPRV